MDAHVVVGGVGIAVMLGMILFTGMSPGLAMLLVGLAGLMVINPPASMAAVWNGVIGAEVWTVCSNYGFTVIPLFVLLGEVIFHAGYSDRLFRAAEAWFGGRRGGLAITTLMASAGFSAICGSNTATAATMSSVAMPPMTKANYNPRLKCGVIAVGSTLGAVIPPSIVLVVYGLYTGVSIGKLFAGSVIPGGVLVVSVILTVIALCRCRPGWASRGRCLPWRERWRLVPGVLEVGVLFAVIMGSMFSGVVTPTEAAGFGAFIGIAGCMLRRRLSLAALKSAMISTLHITGMVFLIITGATVFGKFLVMTGLPMLLTQAAADSQLPPAVILVFMAVCYLVGGCLMDALAFLLISLPLFLPVVEQFGYDLVWFGQLVCVVTTMGAITPPIGVSSFVVASMAEDADAAQVFKGTMYFYPAYAVVIALLFVFPTPMTGWLAGLVK
jgi:tripartite ATP-independent transporter DctM subunit